MQTVLDRRRFLATLSSAGAAGLISGSRSLAQEAPPETTTIRFARSRSLCNAPLYVAEELLRATTASLLLVEADARRNVRQDTRALMNSITHRVTGQGTTLSGTVGPSLRYGLFVEAGTRPHFPPVAALSGWARRHGVNPYALQRAIGRRGTRARPFLLLALQKNLPRIVRLFAAAGARVVVRIGGSA